MERIIYFDLETKYSAEEVGGWENIEDMGMSVGGNLGFSGSAIFGVP